MVYYSWLVSNPSEGNNEHTETIKHVPVISLNPPCGPWSVKPLLQTEFNSGVKHPTALSARSGQKSLQRGLVWKEIGSWTGFAAAPYNMDAVREEQKLRKGKKIQDSSGLRW